MALTDYTSYDEIRAALGVSDDEIEDTTLALPIYSDNLVEELWDISSTLASDYDTVVAIAVGTRTSVQARFYRVTRLFAAYAVARQLTGSLPLFSPKDISDGKATIGRYADSPYKEVIKKTKEEYERARSRLQDAQAALTASTAVVTARSYMSALVPTTDPVTGS